MNRFKTLTQRLRSAYDTVGARMAVALSAAAGLFVAAPKQALAISQTDLTQDTSGGKTLTDVTDNIDQATQAGATLLISLVTIGGFVVVAISLYTLYKASKDEREKPLSAIVGLFIGGAMAAVGSIMWIMRTTVIGA